MILNSFEFNLTEQKIHRLQATIIEVKKKTSITPFLLKLELDSLNAFLNELVKERNEYLEIHQKFKDKIPVRKEILKYPENLVYIRIANNISQEDIATLLNISIEEIKRQEEYLYKNLDAISLFKINDFLEEKISKNLTIDTSPIHWDKFPIKEMLKRRWILPGNIDPISAFKALFTDLFGNTQYELALHKKFHFNGNSPNEYSLLAWQIQVLRQAKEVSKHVKIPKFSKDLSWLNELARISLSPKGPLEAQEFLLSKGIILILEPHLPSTYLDGAAMLLPNTLIPVIGLTLRHDRLDNFWFVLFHELGHVFLHLSAERTAIVDEDIGTATATNQIEVEADQFALNNLIPEEQWDSCMSRFYINEEMLNEDARKLNIHPSIIAGRIRKENNDYQIFNEQIGLKQVRKLFWGDKYDYE
ncbi:ImmA/IrrE family metallo-endopeptidase [Acinetobacter lactucae]|uniref:ImmA/IrrE family metallo-endopeptidase n=1 Tax=Acinetobacter lactucae TaxID=1785128 RepID=UPI0015F42BC2|nr:ImmA/IrrE family metallo-endopeptidase [Acinetobacter lactucae]